MSVTPWNLGELQLPVKGYNAVALSGAGCFIIGIGICDNAIQKAKQVHDVNNRVQHIRN